MRMAQPWAYPPRKPITSQWTKRVRKLGEGDEYKEVMVRRFKGKIQIKRIPLRW